MHDLYMLVMTTLHHLFTPVMTTPKFLLFIAIATLIFVGVMTGLHRLSPQAKKWLTLVCTFIAGLYFLLEFLLPTKNGENFITPTVDPVSTYVIYILIWTMFMGIISLGVVHGRRLLKLSPGWHNSLAFFIAFFAMIVAGALSQNGTAGSMAANNFYRSLFNGLLVNLDAAMFSLLAFYIASAAYRAFRVRTMEAALLMFSALIVMLGMVNFGVTMTSWIPVDSAWSFLRLERLSMWILNWVNMPTQRAVTIGVSVGALAMAMRLWLSLERGAFFSQESQ